ncbi:fumarylacetoacetase [Vitreoscilla stercoraria]|uniref:fumarylacetoacetase n=1 Tax=Vitreoscilla stercoraria TaxID=61 RepID=A0ABY4EGE7_VITST|nr:fumarylacetoacetase [Vitreoscilla stercoraria]UOO92472.1 fumarylacetoacetase [Vitreoscilla stercoraria]
MNLNLRSFLNIAPDSDFSMHNLPYGVFCPPQQSARVGVAIGEYVLDLSVLETAGLLPIHTQPPVFKQDSLNAFIELGAGAWQDLRDRLQEILSHDCPDLRDNATLRKHALRLQSDVTMLLPVKIGGYTDFYSSKEHAYNVGCMFRDPANALLPNWSELPVGYNGRASSVVVSGTDIVRPNGQIKLPNTERPIFSACRKLDFELETGFIVGKATALGDAIALQDAPSHIFGMVLLNDWSARDIQQWEYVPLGPFNAKTFATSISPWVVTMAALEPFKQATPIQEPKPLDYLSTCEQYTFDIDLQVALSIDNDETILANTNFKYLYWSMAQQLTHHTSGGCNVEIGDLMGSGTISGAEKYERGSMLELTWNNTEPFLLNNGLNRGFLEDGDTVIMRGVAQKDGIRVGFGDVRGCVLPAKTL